MTARASERPRASVESLLELLAPRAGRLEFAIRLALICALTTLVAETYQTPEAALTAYVSFFVIKPDRTTSIVMGTAMLFLVTLIIGVVLLVSIAVIDDPLLRVSTMAVLSFCLLFTASASKLKPVGGIIALIVAYALDLLGSAQIGELATRAFLYAWLFVGIPVGVSVVVNLLIGPAPRRLAAKALSHRLAVAADALRTPGPNARRALDDVLSEGPGEIQTWLKLAAVEKTSRAEDLGALRQCAASVTQILLLVDLTARAGAGPWPLHLRERVARTLDEMAAILSAGGYPVEIPPAIENVDAALSPEGAAILAEINEALVHFATQPSPEQLSLTPPPAPESQSQSQSQPQSSAQPEKRAGGFFAADAFTNPVHVQYALKTTGAAMFCYVVYSLLDWPGIHTSLITCYIVSLGTAAETVEKLRLRIFGCLVGAAAGLAAIVFLMPGITSIGGLLAIVFLAALASGWVAAGSPRIAYAGFQIAFAFFLCVIQGSGPAFDLVVARDRIVGIVLGNLVVYLMFTTLWPVSVASRIDPAIASLLRSLSAMVAAANRSGRYLLAGEIRAALGALGQDLELARLEPARVRPTQNWLDARHRAKRRVTALQGRLLLGARLDPAFSSETTARLDRLADDAQLQAESAGDNEAPAEPRPQVGLAGSTSPIRERIRADLDDLERILVHRSGQEEHGWRAGHAPG